MKFVLVPHEQFLALQGRKDNPSEKQEENDKESVDDELSESDILSLLPKRGRNNFQSLLNALKLNGVNWNHIGELIIDSEPIKYSHICDLLHFARFNVKTVPRGAKQVFGKTKRLPLSLISNPSARQLVQPPQEGGKQPPPPPPPGIPVIKGRTLNSWSEKWKVL